MKICSLCRVEKTGGAFHKRSKSPDGLNASCKACRSARRKTYQSEKDYNKLAYWADPETSKKRKKTWAEQNKEKINSYKSEYRKREPFKHTIWDSLKLAKRKQRVPLWLTQSQKDQIKNFYWLAKDLEAITGESYQVDHIVPLLGKNVCGLHVPWNLQVLPADLNNKKNNTFSANTGATQ